MERTICVFYFKFIFDQFKCGQRELLLHTNINHKLEIFKFSVVAEKKNNCGRRNKNKNKKRSFFFGFHIKINRVKKICHRVL